MQILLELSPVIVFEIVELYVVICSTICSQSMHAIKSVLNERVARFIENDTKITNENSISRINDPFEYLLLVVLNSPPIYRRNELMQMLCYRSNRRRIRPLFPFNRVWFSCFRVQNMKLQLR